MPNPFLPIEYTEIEKKETETKKEQNNALNPYMKFMPGDNKIRILSDAIVGWVWWIDANGNIVDKGTKAQKGNKPVRIDNHTKMQVEQFENAKVFWAMQVWNYNLEKAQILEITQSSIRKEIQALTKDSDWGDPRNYDIVIQRVDGDMVSYSVRAKPHTKFDTKGKDIPVVNLKALYEGKDPYKDGLDEIPGKD